MKCEIRVDLSNVRDQLDRILAVTDSPRPVLERVAVQVSKWLVQNFRDKGARFGGWKKVSPVTAMLRRGSGKIYADTMAEGLAKAESIAAGMNPLSDTGALRTSVQLDGAGSVLRYGRQSVTVGSALKYADIHQDGGKQKFRMGRDEWRKFRQRVPPYRGRKPRSLPAGMKRAPRGKPRANWNRFHFAMAEALKRKSGETVRVPRRQFIQDRLNFRETQRLEKIVTRELDRILKARGAGR